MSKMMDLLKRFLRDKAGASAVEFAFIAMVLIGCYFGLSELSQGLMADGKAGRIASSIGDLAAQDTQLTNAEMTDIFNIGSLLVAPFPSSALSMRISSLTSTANVNSSTGMMTVKVDWSDGKGMTPISGTTTIPGGLIEKGQTIILAETRFNYTSPILNPGFEAGHTATAPTFAFDRSYYLRPRRSDTVIRAP